MHIIYIVSGVFLIIYFVMHHADIPFNLGYNSYKLLRTDSTLFFNTRLVWRKSHRDLFSVASNTCFFFLQNTRINQHIVSRFLSNWYKVFANAAYERFQSTEHVCGGTFYRNFQIEKLYESAVVIYRFWNEVRNHLFTVSALFHR